ncbi:MAG TPA: alanine racemase [Tepidisphaeraceae bacterium]|jgi:D-serine deaminase-like pyridoxal phosphate-dependent protein
MTVGSDLKTTADLPTPALVIDAPTVRRNLKRLADYARQHGVKLRPHTKTHKSIHLARMQMELGATGLTVAKAGEAQVMAQAADDILVAYPAIGVGRAETLARLARDKTIRVGIDSTTAADWLAEAARQAGSNIGILVDIDVGLHRTGVQTPREALDLAQYVSKIKGLRLNGIMFYPGHVKDESPDSIRQVEEVETKLAEAIGLWREAGLEARIVSGGSTPTAYQSHRLPSMTEARPGTYPFHDMNGVHGGYAKLDDCAARIVCTVVSTAVPGQFVIDAGTKTLTSDKCGPAPDSGHGYVVEYPRAKIAKLTEEHGVVDCRESDGRPKVGERVTVIPNHICPCVNLQDQIWWCEEGEAPRAIPVDARGKLV